MTSLISNNNCSIWAKMRAAVMVIAAITLSVSEGQVSLHAENMAIGTWKVYPVFGTPPQKVIDTGSFVYYTAGNNLFSYNPADDESYSYTVGNKLSSTDVSNVFYSHDNKTLLICYSNGNMDLLDNDGNVTNLSDIYDSNVEAPYKVNDVEFDGNNMYLATNFGVVQYNVSRGEVIQSGIYGKNITGITLLGDNIVIYADGKLKFINKNQRIHSLNNFHDIKTYSAVNELIGVDDNTLIVRGNSGGDFLCVQRVKFIDDSTAAENGWSRCCNSHTTYGSFVSRDKDGKIYFMADGAIYVLDSTTNYKERLIGNLDEESALGVATATSNGERVWSLTRNGLSQMKFDGEGGITVKMQRFRPEEFSVNKVCMLVPSADLRRLYAQNLGPTGYRFGLGDTSGNTTIQTASVVELESGETTDITAYPVDAAYSSNKNVQRTLGRYIIGPACITEDPADKNVYYVGTSQDGLIKVRDGEFAGRFTSDNAPFAAPWGWRVYGCSFDKAGNMWTHSHSTPWINILPANKVKEDPDKIVKEDWYTPTLPANFTSQMDVQWLHCKKSNMIFLTHRPKKVKLLAIDTRGTYNNFEDDVYYAWEDLVDQDGNLFDPEHMTCMAEDLNGHVWIGSTNGIIEIATPSQATNQAMHVNRLKVPRNDGTNAADYLLAGETVYSISVDGANRKWVGTKDSGVFLIAADGHSVIDNFHTDNSPLATNMINAVYADPRSSNVYFGTNMGLYVYSSDVTPPAEDYSDVYAFPNPVRPDFTGTIYVKGLMDNSLVKIADASGHVVSQGHAEGGLYSWNGCNSTGARVKSGVYYVFMSRKDGSEAAVTKIMIIR